MHKTSKKNVSPNLFGSVLVWQSWETLNKLWWACVAGCGERLAFESFPSGLCRVQITAIFVWVLSPPIWVSPQPFQKAASSKHKGSKNCMFPFICSGCFIWVLHRKSTQYCPSTFSPSVNKPFSSPLFLCLHASFSHFHTWISWKKCNWNGRIVLPSFVAFSSHCLSTPLLLLFAPSPIISSLLPCLAAALSSVDRYVIISLSPPLISLPPLFALASPQARLKPAGQEPSRSTWLTWTTTHRCWYPGRPRCASVRAPTPGSTSQPLTLTQTQT